MPKAKSGDKRRRKEIQREIDKRERKVYDTAEGVQRRRNERVKEVTAATVEEVEEEGWPRGVH